MSRLAFLRRLVSLALALVVLTRMVGARADDVADEADLQFRLGIARYETKDFEHALEHFFVSNRLVPNRNVLFNIGRCYEQLRRGPEAYRYYTLARETETTAAAQRSIDDAIARVAPTVAVLRVTTVPPGATIYLDRKDLGPRGSAPRGIGVAGGNYRVIAELPGYESATSEKVTATVGAETAVALKLRRVTGSLVVDGEPTGATVRVDAEAGEVIGTVGTTMTAPAGRHTLFVSHPGHQVATMPVDIPAGKESRVRVQLTPITGPVVVEADIPGSTITVDGKEAGFTPAVIAVPVGTHVVSVSRSGYRAQSRTLEVRANEPQKVQVELTTLEEVSAASRVTETVEEAPASVTVISSQELRAMAYPTVAEAVRGVRGIYLSDDRSYVTVGVRGFARPGDYGNRILVLLDGHPANDNYSSSSFVGFDGRVDIDDIDRIEIIRGPGSVVYGTSAFFGVINLVTRERSSNRTSVEGALSTAEYGVGRARVTGTLKLGENAGLWTSVAGARGTGRDYFFPELAVDPRGPLDPANPGQRLSPVTNAQGLPADGWARDVDGFEAGTVGGRLWWNDFTVQWFLHSRKKRLPTAFDRSILGDTRTHFADTRGFVEARFEPKLGRYFQLFSRAHADLYDFDGLTAFPTAAQDPTSDGPTRDTYRGRWLGFEQRLLIRPADQLRFTLGASVERHLAADQRGADDAWPYIQADNGAPGRNDPFTSFAGYALADLGVSKALRLSAGGRFDYFSNLERIDPEKAINPRVAVIVKPYAAGTVKLMGGKAFRTPSVYELHYRSPTQDLARGLQPEQILSAELELSHRFSSAVVGTVAGYGNFITDLVELNVARVDAAGTDVTQYQNSRAPVRVLGGEVELRHDWRQGVMLGATYSLQNAQYLRDPGRREVPNSPAHLASVKAAAPIVGRVLSIMSRLSVEGPRFDGNILASDPPQGHTDPGIVWDLVFSGMLEGIAGRWAVGAYNIADSRYQSIPSREFAQRNIVQNGRTFLATFALTYP